MKVDLTHFEAIVLAHALKSSHEKHLKFYAEKGVPDFLHGPTVDNVETHQSAHAALLLALRAEGYPMTDDDLEPFDTAELTVVPI